MEINSEQMSTEMENGIYEQPSLKKYGTMKEITLATAGSGGDAGGMATQIDTSNENPGTNTGESIGGDPPYGQ